MNVDRFLRVSTLLLALGYVFTSPPAVGADAPFGRGGAEGGSLLSSPYLPCEYGAYHDEDSGCDFCRYRPRDFSRITPPFSTK